MSGVAGLSIQIIDVWKANEIPCFLTQILQHLDANSVPL